jgi:hypothetical protein
MAKTFSSIFSFIRRNVLVLLEILSIIENSLLKWNKYESAKNQTMKSNSKGILFFFVYIKDFSKIAVLLFD